MNNNREAIKQQTTINTARTQHIKETTTIDKH